MARQFIYHMQGLSKTYPGNRKVLENINLSFYPDAKIGVLGVNGSGKSTLLRIMAGHRQRSSPARPGPPRARASATCAQEPQLDPDKSVRENVMEGVRRKKAMLDRYNELAMNYSDETADEMTQLQDEIEAQGPVGPRPQGRPGDGRAALPARRCRVTKLSGGERRRVALCRLLLEQPDLLLLDEPTNHLDAESVAWLEGHLRNYPGAILSSPTTATSSTTSPAGSSSSIAAAASRTRATTRPGSTEAEAPGAGGPRGGGAPAHARARAGVDRGLARARARPSPRRATALRGAGQEGGREEPRRPRRSSSRSPSGWARTSSTSRA